MQNLYTAGRTTVFKTLGKPKIVHLALVKLIPILTILEVNKIKKHFILKNGNSKINPFKTTKFQKMQLRTFLIRFSISKIIQTNFDPISIALEDRKIIFIVLYQDKKQNLGFVYELHMFLILKSCLVSFAKYTLLFCHGSLMTILAETVLLITQKSHLSSLLTLLIIMILFTFCPTKKQTKGKGQRQGFWFHECFTCF